MPDQNSEAQIPSPESPPAPVSAPVNGGILVEGLKFSPNWRENLSEKYRAEPCLEPIDNLDTLAGCYINGQKMIGLDKVAIPTENSPPEVWDEFYSKSGRPSTVEDYDFRDIKFPEGAEPTPENIIEAKQVLHELGLSDKQAKGVFEYYKGTIEQGLTANEQTKQREFDEGVAALKKEYGYAYDQKLEKANAAVRTFDPDGVLAELGLANNPAIVKMMQRVGDAISEDKMVGAHKAEAMTPNDAQTQVNKQLANPAYFDKDHPEHANVVAEVTRLMHFMHPEEGPVSKSFDPSTGRLI